MLRLVSLELIAGDVLVKLCGELLAGALAESLLDELAGITALSTGEALRLDAALAGFSSRFLQNDNSCFNSHCNARRSRTSRQCSSTSTTELAVRVTWLKTLSFRCLTRHKFKPRNSRRSDRELQGFPHRNVGAEGYALGISVFWRNFGFSLRVSDVVILE